MVGDGSAFGEMRYKINATDIIIATIVGGGSMLYTCYPIMRRLEDHDKVGGDCSHQCKKICIWSTTCEYEF